MTFHNLSADPLLLVFWLISADNLADRLLSNGSSADAQISTGKSADAQISTDYSQSGSV